MEKARLMAEGRPQAISQDEIRQLEAIGVQQLLASMGRASLLEQESILRHERIKAWNALPAEERTQRISFERWPPGPGTQCYLISMPSPKERPNLPLHQPTVRVNAHSAFEAEALYRDLCGIIQSDWPISVIPAPPEPDPAGAPPAPAAAETPAAVGPGDRPPEGETPAAPQGGKVRKLS
jgi:hypothetical protein